MFFAILASGLVMMESPTPPALSCSNLSGIRVCPENNRPLPMLAEVRAGTAIAAFEAPTAATPKGQPTLGKPDADESIVRRGSRFEAAVRLGVLRSDGEKTLPDEAFGLEEPTDILGQVAVSLTRPFATGRFFRPSLEGEFFVGYGGGEECATLLTVPACVKTDLAVAGLMFGGRIDLFENRRVRPYLGAGIGPIFTNSGVEVEVAGVSESADESETGFGYQGRAGITFDFRKNMTAEFGYRYLGGEAGDMDVELGGIELGFVFKPLR